VLYRLQEIYSGVVHESTVFTLVFSALAFVFLNCEVWERLHEFYWESKIKILFSSHIKIPYTTTTLFLKNCIIVKLKKELTN